MKNPKLTIIIPVYNEKAYLERCLLSCPLGREEVEIILINDGSTDGSGEECDKFARYNNVRVIHQENHGVSYSRNVGIENAEGEWITFLDADDELIRGAYRVILNRIRDENIYEFNHRRQHGNSIPRQGNYVSNGRYTLRNRQTCWWGVWNKVFRRKFLIENNIRFDLSVSYGEDEVFVLECLVRNGRFVHFAEDILLRHFDNKESAVHNLTYKGVLQQWNAEKKLLERLEKKGDYENAKWVRDIIRDHEDSIIYRRRLNGLTPKQFEKQKKSIKTNGMDVVYILKDTPDNEELKYSLRSLKNLPHRKVVFVGGNPEGVGPDLHIPLKQTKDKWHNATDLIKKICKDKRLSEDIILFNDDFFVTKPIDEMIIYKNHTLQDICRYVTHNGTRESEYIKTRIKPTARVLQNKGLPQDNYELHIPMVINRKKMLKICNMFPEYAKRSCYGNYYRLGGINIDGDGFNDGSIHTPDRKSCAWRIFVSTTDESWIGEVGKEMRAKFPIPSRFEKD